MNGKEKILELVIEGGELLSEEVSKIRHFCDMKHYFITGKGKGIGRILTGNKKHQVRDIVYT